MELSNLKKLLVDRRREAKEEHFRNETGFVIAEKLKEALDATIVPAFEEVFSPFLDRCCLYALGGYGRGDLNFHSDIDVNVIYEGSFSDDFIRAVEEFYYFLISLGEDVGFSARTIDEAVKLCSSDISVLTNFLQKRFLFGSDSVRVAFDGRFDAMLKKNGKVIVDEILSVRKDRHKRFYGTVYYQEPNVKESKGGLRDLHEAFWISKIVYGIGEYADFVDAGVLDWETFRDVISAYDFMLRVRNQMHIMCDRKSDILSFELQRDIAKFFGFSPTKSGVEGFMRNYFNAALDLSINTREIIKRSLERKSKKVIHVLKGRTVFDRYFFSSDRSLRIAEDREKEILESPLIVLDGFKIIQDRGLNLSADAFRIFKLSAGLNAKKYLDSKVLAKFRDILSKPVRLSFTLELMHDCNVLDALIPDFARLRGHFQFDIYHKFTTDMHLIFTIRELEKIAEMGTTRSSVAEKGNFYQVLHDLETPRTLYVAALLHDIGKGKRGRHEIIGASIARRYSKRLGFSDSEVEEIEWLVRNHLLMSHFAFRRDITDPQLVEELAVECGSEERLKKLFLLTYADIKAVGPGAWDKWKSALLWELFASTLNVFTEGKTAEELAEEKLKRRKTKVVQIAGGSLATGLLDRVEKAYLLSYPSSEIAVHLELIGKIRESGIPYAVRFESFPDIGFTEITIVTLYRRGLFHRVAGLLSYLGINIKGAKINRVLDDYMVYTIQVSTLAGEPVATEKLDRFSELLESLYAGKLNIDELVEVNLEPLTFRKNLPRPETKIKFDNGTSDKFTIVEVSTHDRLGVLYAITKQLLLANTRLRMAKITTEGNRVIDTFYITDIDYNKITDQTEIKKIEDMIRSVL